jgi:AAA domain
MNERDITVERITLRRNDYDPVAARDKSPVQPQWQNGIGLSEGEIKTMTAQFPAANNTGVNAALTPGLDVDIMHANAAEAVYSVIQDWLSGRGKILRRVGNRPKFLVPFRTDTPFAKLIRQLTAPDGTKHKSEWLARGQQYIAFGRNPDANNGAGGPYDWVNDQSPLNTPRSELPLVNEAEARSIVDYLVDMLMEKFGFAIAKEETKSNGHARSTGFDPETGEVENGFGDSPCADLNAVAMKNQPAWVPALSLYNCKRRKGRYPAWDAVASWRPSTTGRPLEQRKRNLGIVSTGIKDFGNGNGYSPLDLVMAARSCSLAEAFCWLEEKLLPQKSDVDIDIYACARAQDAPHIAPEDPDARAEPSTDGETYPELEKDLEVVGTLWSPHQPLPEPKPMTVPYFVPSRTEPCIGYVGAITGSAKTFTADDLAVAIASGGLFAGQQVTERGVVVLVEMEGSSRVRLKAAIQYRGVEEFKLPIYHSQKMPPVILNKGEVSKEWKDWCIRTIRLVRWQINREYPGLPLTAIILDPLAHFSGITDIGGFAENTTVSKALIDLALKAECLVVIVDHYGKDTTRGLIGSIARESLAYFVLTPGDKLGGDLSKPRQLVIRKMRDGMNNICVDYRLHVWDTKAKQIVDADSFDIPLEDQARRTLVIEWGKEVRRWSDSEEGGDSDSLTPNQRLVLNKINELLNSDGVEPPAECGAPAGLRAVSWVRLWPRLRAQGLSQASATRARTDLLAKGLIGVHGDWIWITLGGE